MLSLKGFPELYFELETPRYEKLRDRSFNSGNVPEVPEGPVSLISNFYVDRPPIESRCYKTITQAGALIRIKAPRQMGKKNIPFSSFKSFLEKIEQSGWRSLL